VKRKLYIAVGLLLVAATMAAGGSVALAQTARPAADQAHEQVPFLSQWMSSGHADTNAMAFNDWNDTNPPAVPADCARCHSTPGYMDYLGADGSQPRSVEKPAPIGTVITCIACHNQQAILLTNVRFPSGIEKGDLGNSSRCAECHQGRASKVQVDQAIDKAGLKDSPDTANTSLRFINIHYFAAAATLYGSEVKGGYEYEGHAYQPRFRHVEGYDTCANCHDTHTLQLKIGECAGCHDGVATKEDLKKIRMNGSLADYDGDGNTSEGIFFEIATLQENLSNAMKSYSVTVAGKAIGYNPDAYPYFFNDLNGNGTIEASEATSANAYNGFTPRLLKAAYNYQTSLKDPGAFAHNAKYIIELLYDSVGDLQGALGQTGLGEAQRNDPGHFDATAEPFRHWDVEGEVPADCVRCHTSEGLPFFLENGVTIAMDPAESMKCTTCHANQQDWALIPETAVPFPSGATLSFPDSMPSNLCINCHQGRESKVSVDTAIQSAGVGANEVSPSLAFRNPHYFAAGATLFGTEAKGAYEFDGKQYKGRFMHVPSYDTCVECHDPHRLNVRTEQCSSCHGPINSEQDLFNIRLGSTADFDGDGDTTEGVAMEVETMREKLLAAIQGYTSRTTGVNIAYSSLNYPYWYVDANGNGEVDADEVNAAGRYAQWTPNLLRAAYNYQWATKDPGAFAHNGDYILQVLYDSIQAVGSKGAVAGMTRP